MDISRYTVLGWLQITKDNLQPGFIVFHESWSELDHATGGEKRRKEKQIEKNWKKKKKQMRWRKLSYKTNAVLVFQVWCCHFRLCTVIRYLMFYNYAEVDVIAGSNITTFLQLLGG